MCGIAGVLEFGDGLTPDIDGLQRMARVLVHRGPDEVGFYREGSIGLAHRRLSIIDLSAGKQPMGSPDGQSWVVFNGEIYNFPQLRNELENKGYVFRTRSDTEVLLTLYIDRGLDAFSMLNGMFACAFWDRRQNRLILARDRFGKKPLFYYHDAHRFLFGSEIKALLAYGTIARDINHCAVHEYLSHSYIVGEDTIIEGIRRLPPAHLLVVENCRTSCRSFWQIQFNPDPDPVKEDEVVEKIEWILRDAVKCRMISDVPLGAFLSGGLDSSMVVSMMAGVSENPVKTFTIGFGESDYSEIEDARTVATYLRTDHHEIIVRPSSLDILPDLVWYLDEPFGDSSALPTYYVCKAAREHVTVALSGDGGDESFAGYIRYLALEPYSKLERVPGWIRRAIIKPLNDLMPFTWPGWNFLYAMGRWEDGGLPYSLGVFPHIRDRIYSDDFKLEIKSSDPFESVNQILARSAHLDPVSRYQYLDTLVYLPFDILTKVDRMSMANSLEVRSPFLDHRLVEFMAALPISYKLRDGLSKYVLRKLGTRMLPSAVLSKRKQGFAIPKGQWFQKDLCSFAEEILTDPRTISRGYFHKGNLKRVLTHHATGRRDYSNWIWSLIILEMWFRTFLDCNIDDQI